MDCTRRQMLAGGLAAVGCGLAARGGTVKSNIGARSIMATEDHNKYPLPDGLVAVEYLESTGTQYIDLMLNSSADNFCDFEICYQNTTDDCYPPFGYQYGASARYGMWRPTGGGATLLYVGINSANYVSFNDDLNWHTIIVKNGDSITVDGISTPIGTGTVRGNIGVLAFAMVTSAREATSFRIVAARISMLKIYDTDNNLLRDLVPCRRDRTGYMYDLVSGELFGNSGIGEFLLGRDL